MKNTSKEKAKPKEMNNLDLVRAKPIDEKAITLGLSTLHCWIRTFEYVLHLGYKLCIGKYQARTAAEKLEVEHKKSLLRKCFVIFSV